MPPQAYTREMLAQAFDWLKGQPQYIRERATTADGLVSMYLQSRRANGGQPAAGSGHAGLATGSGTGSSAGEDAPSVESFKSDLRHLAENMKSFESPVAFETPVIRPPATHHTTKASTVTTAPDPKPEFATVTATVTPARPIEPKHSYDSQTMEAIQTVRQKLNLSSDSEALRMLVKLGFEKVRSILP